MNKYLIYATYGWLALSGTLHFLVDVVSHVVRGKHPPGPETTLYYGLHTAFSLGQVAFGLLGLLLAWRAMPLVADHSVLALTLLAGLGWWAITFLFMPYWEPKLNLGIFCALALAAWVTR
ncbi:hypothetical protein [Roseateles amylovorans]|uniref:Uncharacterized protein n=1 Tax=Roseateles amylovorans TaxID=2978473 RepID=A0ABY6AW73_9BURK|nr:hypothetical protein [Roseateles amylovorans]UXH77122.1 hypothetical protein N4261_19200 [Roseateles amylovorans]